MLIALGGFGYAVGVMNSLRNYFYAAGQNCTC